MDAVDEAIAAYLIEEVEHSPGDYRFVHALIQQTLCCRTVHHGQDSPPRSNRRDPGEYAGKRDRTRASANSSATSRRPRLSSEATSWSNTSSWRVNRRSAPTPTRKRFEYFRQALNAKGESQADDQLASILFGLGRAQVATAQRHEMQNAVETLTRAFDYYEKTGDVETALQVAEYPVMATTGITGITHLISRALVLAGPDSHRSGRLWGRYIRAAALEQGEYQQASDAYLRAVEIARRERDIGFGGPRLRRCGQRRRLLLSN